MPDAAPFARLPRPEAGRRLVVADIHGCARSFEALLHRLALTADDHLYLLGDYVNKGPASARVLDTVMALRAKGYRVFTLRGNHEQKLLDAEAVSPDALRAVAEEENAGDLLTDAGRLKPVYRRFMERLPYYFELDDCYLVHAGFDFGQEAPFEAYEAMLEIRDFPATAAQTGGRRIVHGHNPMPLGPIAEAVANGALVVPLDNGCVYYGEREDQGRLLCLDLDAWTLVVQENIETL